MSSSYRPNLRETFAHCWTEGSWIAGGICLPERRSVLDHLNQKEAFIKLRNAVLSPKKPPLPFLALRRDRVALVVPPMDEPMETPTATSSHHRVVCLLKGAILSGTLSTLPNLRVSDFLMRASGFFTLGDCQVRMAGKLPFESPVSSLWVNSERVIGVAEDGE